MYNLYSIRENIYDKDDPEFGALGFRLIRTRLEQDFRCVICFQSVKIFNMTKTFEPEFGGPRSVSIADTVSSLHMILRVTRIECWQTSQGVQSTSAPEGAKNLPYPKT